MIIIISYNIIYYRLLTELLFSFFFLNDCLPLFSRKTINFILTSNYFGVNIKFALSLFFFIYLTMMMSGWKVPFCYSQGGCLERDGCPEKLHHGNYLQWLQPRNIQGAWLNCLVRCLKEGNPLISSPAFHCLKMVMWLTVVSTSICLSWSFYMC